MYSGSPVGRSGLALSALLCLLCLLLLSFFGSAAPAPESANDAKIFKLANSVNLVMKQIPRSLMSAAPFPGV